MSDRKVPELTLTFDEWDTLWQILDQWRDGGHPEMELTARCNRQLRRILDQREGDDD